MYKVFIDGQSGTTGLQIYERILHRADLKLLEIPEEERKNPKIKEELYSQSDLVILCLPDSAAKEAAALLKKKDTKIIDASTAHRVAESWIYGLPELNSEQRDLISNAKKVSNPGCYPTGFLLALAPLVEGGIVPQDYPVTVNAVSGYSGGGKSLITKYEQHDDKEDPWSFRPYSLALHHKHVPEMKRYSNILYEPLFVPSVGDFYNGMLVMVPLVNNLLKKDADARIIHEFLIERYADETFVNVMPFEDSKALDEGFLSPLEANHTNRVDLMVWGHEKQTFLVARLDNLGKGASGAAVQNMNLMLGLEESSGLV